MNQQTKKSTYRELSEAEFQLMLKALDSMFGDNYFDKNSKGYKKALMTFEKLKRAKCTIDEFEYTMRIFSNRHTLNYWMPAHIYQIWRDEVGYPGVVM